MFHVLRQSGGFVLGNLTLSNLKPLLFSRHYINIFKCFRMALIVPCVSIKKRRVVSALIVAVIVDKASIENNLTLVLCKTFQEQLKRCHLVTADGIRLKSRCAFKDGLF